MKIEKITKMEKSCRNCVNFMFDKNCWMIIEDESECKDFKVDNSHDHPNKE